jgi:hypothetical protein
MLGGMPNKRSDLVRLQWTTMVLGAVALISLSIIGRVIAVMAMISVIGIPLVFLFGAIPTLFLLSLFTLAIAAALNLQGGKRIALALPLALGAMLLFPLVHNAIGTAYVASLVKEDQTPAIEPWARETMALVVPTDRDVECNSICQKMLGRGYAQRFIVASVPAHARGVTAVKKSIAYRLEPRRPCQSSSSTFGMDPTLKLKLAQGACLVEEPAPLLQADAVLWHRDIHADNVSGAWLNPFKLPIAAKRFSFYRLRGTTRHDEVWRQTSVRYATLWPLLVPTYVFSKSGFDAPDAGLLREPKTAGAKDVPEAEAFLQNHLRLDLSKQPVPNALLQQTAVNTILSQAAGYGGADPARFLLLLRELSEQKSWEFPLEKLESVLNATVRDQRIPISEYMRAFVAAAYHQSPEFGDAVANAMIDRLHSEPTGSRNVDNLIDAFRFIPDQNLGRLWPRIRLEIKTMADASVWATVIRRAWLADNPTPDLLKAMSLQNTTTRDIYRRKHILHSAMAGLCDAALAGRAGADALPAFAGLLQQPGFLPDSLPQERESPQPDVVAVANTLAALGADREYIQRLKLHPYIAGALKPLIEQALRKPNCKFQ